MCVENCVRSGRKEERAEGIRKEKKERSREPTLVVQLGKDVRKRVRSSLIAQRGRKTKDTMILEPSALPVRSCQGSVYGDRETIGASTGSRERRESVGMIF